MASVVIAGDTSGTVALAAPAVAGTTTLTLPTTSGTILTSASSVARSQLPIGSVLQVVSMPKTDTFTTTSTTDVAITNLSATITPTRSTSGILVLVNIGCWGNTSNDYGMYLSLYRSASLITGAVGAASGSRKVSTVAARIPYAYNYTPQSIMYLDYPSSTSSLSYACYVAMEPGGGTAVINRSGTDSDIPNLPRTISTITLMEIAA